MTIMDREKNRKIDLNCDMQIIKIHSLEILYLNMLQGISNNAVDRQIKNLS